MTRREKFFKTIYRELEGYIPFEIWFAPPLLKKFKEKTGTEDYWKYWDIPLRFIMPKCNIKANFTKYFDNLDNLMINEWGIGHRKGEFEHFTKIESPMSKFTTLDEFKNYPYIDPENDFDWEAFKKQVKDLQDQDLIVFAGLATTVFEVAWQMRGFENLMYDLYEEPELACYLMDRITSIRVEWAKRYAQAGCDCLHLGDDVSTQLDMMLSPEMWRKFLKPRLKRVIDAAKAVKPDIIIDYHGDGNLTKIIPDLIEIGVQILNPIQPECMDPIEIKRIYGDKLAFRGCIGTQTTMPFGTPEEVDMVCRKLIEKVGKGGGLILSPTHMLEPEVPWENIEAYINAIKKYSRA